MTTLSKALIPASLSMGLLCVAPVSNAQPVLGSAPSFYLGVGAGVANLEDNVEVEDLGDVELDDDSTAFKVFGGWRATPNFGIEAGYRNFGEADVGPFTVETDGLDVNAVVFLPIGPVDLFAKGGAIFWNTDASGPLPDDDGQDLMYGAGVQVNIASLLLRVESEWFEFDFPDEAQMITGSVGWTF